MDNFTEDTLVEKLLEKSQEAFIMGIEIYNKPTIKYRVEGFAFFICNAWELLLKAYLIKTKGSQSIYFTDKQSRTISIEQSIKKIFTNDKDPLRINLEQIVSLRNTCTHFITEEYEVIYAPLFQSCVMNYSNKLLEFFNIDITEKIAQNFLTLSMKLDEFEPKKIKARYPKEIAERILLSYNKINEVISNNNNNDKLAIIIEHDFIITKNHKTANASFAITQNAKQAAFILKQPQDMHQVYPLSTGDVIKHVNSSIKKEKIKFKSYSPKDGKETIFNKYHFGLFSSFYQLKSNKEYCYQYREGKIQRRTYHQKTVKFIIDEIKKDPENIVRKLKASIKKEQARE